MQTPVPAGVPASRMADAMPFEAEVRIEPRARRLSVRVHPGGRTVVTVPKGCSFASVLRFMRRHRDWVARTAARVARFPPTPSRSEARRAYLLHKEAARRFVYAAIARLAPAYGVAVRSVSIRDQKTRWGSCSRDGCVSFNYRLALLPARLAEYVVAHELCHLLEFNHSPRFWALVARTVPEHRLLRKALRDYHPAYA